MSGLKHTVCLLALFTIFSQTSGASLDQSRLGRQNDQDDALIDEEVADETVSLEDLIIANRKQGWTTCDWRVTPKFSCYDCNTRVICKPIGGILKPCGDSTPYCKNGFCSAVPSDECSILEDNHTKVDDVSEAEAVVKEAIEVKAVEKVSEIETSGTSSDKSLLIRQKEQNGALADEEVAHETVSLDDLVTVNRKQGWTTCDWKSAPKFSCNDCNTRVICQPIGGILKYCGGNTPYCRNGFCSAVPSDECSIVEEVEDNNSEVDDASEALVEEEASEVKAVEEVSETESSGTSLDQSRLTKQNEQNGALADEEVAHETVSLDDLVTVNRKQGWTTCDWKSSPKFSCHDCNTRVICKPIGGILKACGGNTPYCRNGFCSAVPSNECSIVEEVEDNSDVDDVSEAEAVEEEASEVEAVEKMSETETSFTNRLTKQNEEDDALTDEEVVNETVSSDDLVTANRKHGWATCDWKGSSKFSCNDCNTRVICKKIGGILKPCGGNTPYCRNGFCSAVPSDECANVEEVQDDNEDEHVSEIEVEEGVSEVEEVTDEVNGVETVDEEISEIEGEIEGYEVEANEHAVDDVEIVEEEPSDVTSVDEEVNEVGVEEENVIEIETIVEEVENIENVEGNDIEVEPVSEVEENQDEILDEATINVEDEEKENIDNEAVEEDVNDVDSIEEESEVQAVDEEVGADEDLGEQLN